MVKRAKKRPNIDQLVRQVEQLRAMLGPQEPPAASSINPQRTPAQMREAARVSRHPGGRPKSDPADLRSDRLGLRIHPDLRTELEALAREDGLRLAHYTERALVDHVNRVRGGAVLDRIGRCKESR